jgi:hypothetical protein
VQNLAGNAVGAYQFDVEYDPSVIRPAQVAADISGTRGEGLSVVYNSPKPGLLKAAVYGAIPVNGDGVYANLKFVVIGDVGSATPLAITDFRLNDGTSQISVAAGRVTVTDASNSSVLMGRLVTPTGNPVADAAVTLTSTTGRSRSTTSNHEGRFEFGGLTSGETYTVSVDAKLVKFTPLTVSITGNVTAVDMIARP